MATKKSGGARNGAGRKTVDDKKLGVTIYVRESVIEGNGGVEEVKDVSVDYLNKRHKRLATKKK